MPTTSVPASAGICRAEHGVSPTSGFDTDKDEGIMNATMVKAEVFERVDYDELIAEMRPRRPEDLKRVAESLKARKGAPRP